MPPRKLVKAPAKKAAKAKAPPKAKALPKARPPAKAKAPARCNARLPTPSYVASVNALADTILAPTTAFTKLPNSKLAVVHKKK